MSEDTAASPPVNPAIQHPGPCPHGCGAQEGEEHRSADADECDFLREWETGWPRSDTGYTHEMNRYGEGAAGNSVVNIDHETVVELVRQARAALRAQLRDWEDSAKQAASESCPDECARCGLPYSVHGHGETGREDSHPFEGSTEKHCTCVGLLRAQLRDRPTREEALEAMRTGCLGPNSEWIKERNGTILDAVLAKRASV